MAYWCPSVSRWRRSLGHEDHRLLEPITWSGVPARSPWRIRETHDYADIPTAGRRSGRASLARQVVAAPIAGIMRRDDAIIVVRRTSEATGDSV
jgi:hypothetical protein